MKTERQLTGKTRASETAWSEEQLRHIFADYNRKYWRGRLPNYRIVIAAMPDAMGLCDWTRKAITIDVEQHKSDREVRSTLLHEMAHAAASIRGSRGHDPKFFAQLEKLLQLRAPIGIDTPEAGSVRILARLVPSWFPLLKRKIDLAEARRTKDIEGYAAEHNLHTQLITDDDILREFEDSAMELTWRKAVIAVGLRNGMVDETGRPLTHWSRRLLEKAKRKHARARRDHLQYEKACKDFQSFAAAYANRKPATGVSRMIIPPLVLPKGGSQ
jgi:SprT-like family